MATMKINLGKFNGKNDFNMWKVKMKALLITQGLGDAIEHVTKKEGKHQEHLRGLLRLTRKPEAPSS